MLKVATTPCHPPTEIRSPCRTQGCLSIALHSKPHKDRHGEPGCCPDLLPRIHSQLTLMMDDWETSSGKRKHSSICRYQVRSMYGCAGEEVRLTRCLCWESARGGNSKPITFPAPVESETRQPGVGGPIIGRDWCHFIQLTG
jgi:hypothetical protein